MFDRNDIRYWSLSDFTEAQCEVMSMRYGSEWLSAFNDGGLLRVQSTEPAVSLCSFLNRVAVPPQKRDGVANFEVSNVDFDIVRLEADALEWSELVEQEDDISMGAMGKYKAAKTKFIQRIKKDTKRYRLQSF